MTFRLLCFAGLRDTVGRETLTIDLPEDATVRDLKSALEKEWPLLAGRLASVRVAADLEFLDEGARLPEGVELALIPPVSGGSGVATPAEAGTLVRLTPAPLSFEEAISFVRDDASGAIATFAGTVRVNSRGRIVVALEYEAYAPMAVAWLERLAARGRSESGARRVAILHRLGRVAVGELSLVVAVSAAHRAEAFDACRAIVEGLKADVPIWKREFDESGEIWVGWGS